MKKYGLLSLLLASAGVLSANDATLLDAVRFQYTNFLGSCGRCESIVPYGFMATGDGIAKADLSSDNSQNIRYRELETNALYSFKVNPESGITLEAGYGNTYMKWNENPYFTQSSFNYVNLGLLGYTGDICGWFWQAGLGTHLNDDHGGDILSYSRWTAFLWGRYKLSSCVGMHVGTLTLTGMRKTVTYPILGIDWRISKHWKLDAIYPVDMQLAYLITDEWTLSAFIRPFLTRQRVSNTEAVPEAIFEYRNVGSELNLSYQYKSLFFSVFGGYTFSAILKTMDRNGDNGIYNNFQSAPYVGFNTLIAF